MWGDNDNIWYLLSIIYIQSIMLNTLYTFPHLILTAILQVGTIIYQRI